MAEEYEIFISRVVAHEDPAQRVVLQEYLPASARRVSKLNFDFARQIHCDNASFDVIGAFDRYGADWQTRTIKHYYDVRIDVRGIPWWRGYITGIRPRLQPGNESVTVQAVGYGKRLKEALITWLFTRQALKTVGDVGEIAGVVRALFLLSPLLLGTDPLKPHPIADTYSIHTSVARPRGLVFDAVSLEDVFTELATLAGNYDWGVDADRQFYFHSPQVFTAGTAEYNAVGTHAWSADGTGGYYGDESFVEPQAVPPFLTVQDEATFVLGGAVESYDANDTSEGAKNTLVIFAAPRTPGNPLIVKTVTDARWLEYWDQRLPARVAAPFFSEDEDIRRWGRNRLQLMGRPQFSGGVKGPYRWPRPVRPVGASRIIDPVSGREIIERINAVKFALTQHGVWECNVELGYTPPPETYFAEQLRRDATLSQNSLAASSVPFILSERMRWPEDRWNVQLI